MDNLYKVIVKAWVKKESKYLLAQRGNSERHHAGIWSLPGGNIESDVEDNVVENTLKRELQEEIGIEIEDRIELVYTNSFVKTSDNSKVINLTFLVNWKSGEARPLEDTAQVKWFTIDELNSVQDPPDFLIREIKALNNFLNSQPLVQR